MKELLIVLIVTVILLLVGLYFVIIPTYEECNRIVHEFEELGVYAGHCTILSGRI